MIWESCDSSLALVRDQPEEQVKTEQSISEDCTMNKQEDIGQPFSGLSWPKC